MRVGGREFKMLVVRKLGTEEVLGTYEIQEFAKGDNLQACTVCLKLQ